MRSWAGATRRGISQTNDGVHSDPLLLFDVLFDSRKGCASYGSDEVTFGPQGWQPAPKPGKLLPKQPRGTTFHQPHQPMEAELRIDGNQQMDMVRHDFHLDDLGPPLRRHLVQNALQTLIDTLNQYPPPILGAPDYMVLAGIHDVAAGLERTPHERIIPQREI